MLTRARRSEERKSSSRHASKCSICRRADRKDIEEAHLRWRSPENFLREVRLSHHSAIYRHAHATGLAAKREAHPYASLEYIIEKAQSVTPMAHAVITAVRICAQLNGTPKEPQNPHCHPQD